MTTVREFRVRRPGDDWEGAIVHAAGFREAAEQKCEESDDEGLAARDGDEEWEVREGDGPWYRYKVSAFMTANYIGENVGEVPPEEKPIDF